MNKFYVFLLAIFLFSCSKKNVQLPQLQGVSLSTEVKDYSAIYIFFDEKTQKAELNKNSLISTTNWVFNIDKRLIIKQVAEEIVILQEKRKNPSFHDNPHARNYFSVADMTAQKFKFLDFTKTEFLIATGSQLSENVLDTTNFTTFLETIKNKNVHSPETIFLSGNVTFQDFIIFLQKVQQEGIFIKKIYVI